MFWKRNRNKWVVAFAKIWSQKYVNLIERGWEPIGGWKDDKSSAAFILFRKNELRPSS